MPSPQDHARRSAFRFVLLIGGRGGVLYDRSVSGAVVFSVVVQAAALPLLLKVRRMGRTRTA